MTDVTMNVQTYNTTVAVTIPVPTVDTTFVQLSDAKGVDKFEVKDIDGFTVATIDSKGDLRIKGKILRI